MGRIRKVKMYKKTLICVERLRRIEIIPDSTGVEFGRFHCIWLKRFQPWYNIYSGKQLFFFQNLGRNSNFANVSIVFFLLFLSEKKSLE